MINISWRPLPQLPLSEIFTSYWHRTYVFCEDPEHLCGPAACPPPADRHWGKSFCEPAVRRHSWERRRSPAVCWPHALLPPAGTSTNHVGWGCFTRSHKLCDCLFVGCLTSQQASVSQGRIYSDNFTCCHTEIEVADSTFYLTQSQYTDTGLTSPSADPITPGAWQGSHWSANF